MGDARSVAIVDGAPAVPGPKNGLGGEAKLLHGVLGEYTAGQPLDNHLELFGAFFKVLGSQVRVGHNVPLEAQSRQNVLEGSSRSSRTTTPNI